MVVWYHHLEAPELLLVICCLHSSGTQVRVQISECVGVKLLSTVDLLSISIYSVNHTLGAICGAGK
jgi:hypothetical protein